MADIRVHVLTTYKTTNSLAFNYPLLINRPFFDEKGVKIYFYNRLSKGIGNCDVIFINSKFFRAWHPNRKPEIYDTLAGLKKRVQKVIWFDTTDSTGTTQFDVMPFVDGYYKGQVLKDRSMYSRPFYGYRIFTDYCKERFGVRDTDQPDRNRTISVTLQPEHAHKLQVSWNSAMNEWGSYKEGELGCFTAWIRMHLPLKTDYTVRFIQHGRERKADILGRIGLSHARNTVRYPREQIVRTLKEKFNTDFSKIPRKEYIEEIKNSKIGVSPFGLGEISCRDFEIIINGALLFKQDMSHLETWPPLYVNNETYVPFSWDLGDFEEKLRALLGDREKIAAISKKAQDAYSFYLGEEGQSEFHSKILKIVDKKA